MKRLIALEGEFVQVDPEELPSRAHWLVFNDLTDGGSIKIPPGHCWVEGDNHEASIDSRFYGPVSCMLHLHCIREVQNGMGVDHYAEKCFRAQCVTVNQA